VIINRPTENELLQAGFNVQFLRKRKKSNVSGRKEEPNERNSESGVMQGNAALPAALKLARTGSDSGKEL